MAINKFYKLIIFLALSLVSTIAIAQFSQLKKISASDGMADDEYGFEVDISNNVAIVGSRLHDENGSDIGAAYIYEMNQGGTQNWGLVKKLVPTDGTNFDNFGIDVAIDGDIAIVGSRNDDDNGFNSGSVYVFGRDIGGDNNWGQITKILANEETDFFGENVDIFDDLVIVGAIYDPVGGVRAGAAYIFGQNQGGSNNWGQIKKLKASDPSSDDRFGENVTINADYAVVGSRLDDDNGAQSGSAYVYSKNHGGTNNWGQIKKLTPLDGDALDNFGSSVAIEDNFIAIGAWGDTDDGNRSGSAYIYERDAGGTNNWGEIKKVQADVFKPLIAFGWSIFMKNNFLIVGAPTEDVAAGDSGAAYIFQKDEGGINNWGFVNKITQDDGSFNDRFGESVALDANFIIVGAHQDDDNGNDSGSAYIFNKPQICTIPPVSVFLDQSGISSIDTSNLDISDFSAQDTVYITNIEFTCPDVLTNPNLDSLIGITGTDTIICTFEVTVLDTISPTATCEDITTYLDSFGLVTVSPIAISHTTDDNCAANLIRVFPDDFTCVNIGDNSATFQTIDPSGNTGDCPLTITVVDSFPPFTDCKDLTIYLDDIGFYFLSAEDIDSITHLTYDNCSIDSVGISQEDFSCAHMPSTITTITFKDQSGNISTCDVVITVLDTIAPVLDCNDLTFDLDVDGQVSIESTSVGMITDNCVIDTQYIDKYDFDCSNLNLSVGGFTTDTVLFVRSFLANVAGGSGGIDASDSLIYISNPSTDEVRIYDYMGSHIQTINVGGGPKDIAVDDNGNIYVLIDVTEEVFVFDASGSFQFNFFENITMPISIDIYNNKIYINNNGVDQVSRFDLNGNLETVVISGSGSNLGGMRVTEDKIVLALGDSVAIYDLSGNFQLGFPAVSFPQAGVIDRNQNLYIPRWNIGAFTVHDNFTGQERYQINDGLFSICTINNKLIGLGNEVYIYDLLLSDTSHLNSVILTAIDESGNISTCSSTITITDTHGYCCPDSLIVNYNPIDSTNYYASDSICSNGSIATGTSVHFRSTIIKMDTSFQVHGNGTFQVTIEDCNN